MKKVILIISFCLISFFKLFASPGDSIFAMPYVHNMYVTFPYPNFYDSLIATNVTDMYLSVNIDFNGELFQNVGIKVKGNSSFNNPSQKKSFKVDFNTFVPAQDIHGLKKLNFNNCFKDPSFMREKLTNDFLIAHNIHAPRTAYCNVYFNNQLWGIYAVVEAIDDEFCKAWFGNNDGNLFQGDPQGSLQWFGAQPSAYYQKYDLENNNTLNDWTDLVNLIDVINNTTNANLQAALDAVLNTNDFLKQWVCLNMFSSLDSYLGSGHNYYIYHDTLTNKFQWIAWDNNEAFGSFKMQLSNLQLKNLDMYYVSNATSRPLINKMLANPAYKSLYNQAYCELKDDFTNAYFDSKIDSLDLQIKSSVYADPKKFYTNSMYDSSLTYDLNITGPQGINVFGLKNFVSTRALNIQNNFIANNVVCTNSIENSADNFNLIISPNPVKNSIHIISSSLCSIYKLYSMDGKEIASGPCNGDIDVSNYSAGVYFLSVLINDRLYYQLVNKID
ncbi:MAG TPA: CotH kinase family protein [Bacteroidia bacterium]|nr:CotH kinase family protein [Bacteroidia bacterium]